MLASSSLMSCAEGSPVGELVRWLGVCMVGELAPGLLVFAIFQESFGDRESWVVLRRQPVGLLKGKITCGRVWTVVTRARE